MAFIDKVRNLLKKRAPSVETPEGETTLQDAFDKWGGRMPHNLRHWYLDSLEQPRLRKDKYDRYEYLDKNLAEASASLTIYADNIVSGSIGGKETYDVVIDERASNLEKLEEAVSNAERQTKIKYDIWDIARDLCCFGDVFEELVVAKREGKLYIQRIKELPIRQMTCDVNEFGVFNDPDMPYIQYPSDFDEKGIPMDWWRVVHFKIGRRVYGVDRSIFANASQRIGRQLLWIDDSMVMARMSRAWMRYLFLIDTTNVPIDEKFEYVERWMQELKRKEVVTRSTGRIHEVDAPWLPDDDIGLPVDKDSKQDVRQLAGDTNVGNIEDVKYLQNKFLMALQMPKAYVSIEEGTRSKATLGQIDVQFARQVRRRQDALVPGLEQFYKTVFTLADIDPKSFKWSIVFPELATADELVKWEMQKMKAEIAKTYVVDIGVLNNTWIMKELLGFNDDQVKQYALIMPGTKAEEVYKLNPELALKVRRDPAIRQMLDDLTDIVGWKIGRDEELAGMKRVGVQPDEFPGREEKD